MSFKDVLKLKARSTPLPRERSVKEGNHSDQGSSGSFWLFRIYARLVLWLHYRFGVTPRLLISKY